MADGGGSSPEGTRLRTLAILGLVAVVAGGPLAGCLDGSPVLPEAVRPYQGAIAPAIPWLDLALAADPATLRLPQDVGQALSILIPNPGKTPLSSDGSLQVALAAYAMARGSGMDPGLANDRLAAFQLTPAEEEALASVITAVVAVDQAYGASLQRLTGDERRLLGLDQAALDAWFAAEPGRSLDDLDRELARLSDRVDPQAYAQAVHALAAAVDEARPALGGRLAQEAQPGPVDGWDATRELMSGLGPVPPRAVDPGLDLASALASLSRVLGVPTPAAPALPPDLDHAVAQVVAAHAAGASADPAWHAQWVLDAVHDALPVLQRSGASWPASAAAAGSGPHEAAPEPQSSCVSPTLPGPDNPSTLTQAPSPPSPPAAVDPETGAVAVAIPSVGPGCAANPLLLAISGPGNDRHRLPALIRIDLGGDDHYAGEVAGRAVVDDGQGRRRSIGSLGIDVGGHDHYATPSLAETQGFASTGFSALFDVAGDDVYEAGDRSQGSACCAVTGDVPVAGPGGIGLLLDLGGADTYLAGSQSQGHASGGVASLVSPAGTQRGTGGFLIDVDGDDEYSYVTQGKADACPTGAPLVDSVADRVLAVFWDMQGNDTYRSSRNAVNTQTQDLFANQGIATCSSTAAPPTQLVAGAFVDSAGQDHYIVLAVPARKPHDASAAMNGAERIATHPSGSGLTTIPKAVGVFRDLDGSSSSAGPDADKDGFGDAAEAVAGTDPADAEHRPSDLASQPPEDAPRWVFVPRPASALEAQNLLLPGLAILGPADNALTETFDVVIDLGGDDVYAAPRLAGVLPYEQRPEAGPSGGQQQPWYASLVLDAGNGTDTYRPPDVTEPSRHCKATDVQNPCERDSGEPDPFHNRPLLAVGASLGGAVNGVAFLADHGGTNSFTVSVLAQAESLEDTQTSERQAVARAMGVSQGAGVNGGLGILATWDSENTFSARVVAAAREAGGSESRPFGSAIGVVQGAGWNGAGLLLAFGDGADEVSSSVQAVVDPPGAARTQALAVSQGAARGGVGILVDAGGDAAFHADQPVAQGAGWTLDQRMEKPLPRVEGLTTVLAGSIPASSAGLLFVGAGDHLFSATAASQGMALGMASVPDGEDGDAYLSQVHDRSRSVGGGSSTAGGIGTGDRRLSTTDLRGLPALGILASLTGSDEYRLRDAGIGGQGRGIAGGIALLLDLAGDDLYDARNALGVQGSGHLGQGILLDLAGHDRYRAVGEAQGHATDHPAVLAHVAACVGNPGDTARAGIDVFCTRENIANVPTRPGEDTDYGTSQAHVRALGQFPVLGLLVDRHGSDSYAAHSLAQGAAHAVLAYGAEAGACKARAIRVGSTVNNEQTAFLVPCETPVYPGQSPTGTAYPAESPRPVPPTERDTAPPQANGFVVGVFVDGSLTDRYDPAVPGREALDPTTFTDGNDWAWRNVMAGSSNLNQTRLPSEIDGLPALLPDDVPLERLDAVLAAAQDLVALVDGAADDPPTDQVGPAADALRDARDLAFPAASAFCRGWIAIFGLGTVCDSMDAALADAAAASEDLLAAAEGEEDGGDGPSLGDSAEALHEAIATLQGILTLARTQLQAADEALDQDDDPDGDATSLPGIGLPGQAGVLGLGVDDASLDDAARLVMGQVAEVVGEIEVELRLARDLEGSALDPGAVKGVVFLLATVRAPVALPAGRLDVLVDHGFLAEAEETGRTATEAQYAYRWDTAAQADGLPLVPDGSHLLEASFFVTEGTTVESRPPLTVAVDNPPVMKVEWTGYSAGALNETDRILLSPSRGHEARFEVTLSPDVDADGPAGGVRGALLAIALEGPERKTIFAGELAAGRHAFVLDGECAPGPCADGDYRLDIVAADLAGGAAMLSRNVTLDGTGPRSTVDMPGLAGVAFRSGGQGLQVHYSASDQNGSLPGSGLTAVDLVRVHETGNLQRVGGGLAGLAVVKEGVATNATLRLVTVARDRLGNQESPCAPAEPAPCARAKLAAAAAGAIPVGERPRDVTIDFAPPAITAAEASHRFVAPGVTPVVFRAAISEVGSGLEATVLRLDDGSEFPLVRSPDGTYVFGTWNQSNVGRSALEEPFFYSFVAIDHAANAVAVDGDGVLDALAPRMTLLGTQYRDGADVERTAGKPGSQAFVTLDIVDAAVARVVANVSALEEGRPDQECEPAAGPYVCPLFLPLAIADGTYTINITAEDLAGNSRTLATDLLVSDEALGMENLTLETSYDSAVLRWTTPRPGTSQAFFSLTRTVDPATRTLRSETPLDPAYTTVHEIRITGLLPSKDYFFQAASQNEAGTQNVSVVVAGRTLSALNLGFPSLAQDAVLSGQTPLVIDVGAKGGKGVLDDLRVDATWRVAMGNTTNGTAFTTLRQMVAQVSGVFGQVPVMVDTTLLADGRYAFFAEARRKGDDANATSPSVIVDNGAPFIMPIQPLPEGEVAAFRPTLNVAVYDTLGTDAIVPETLEVEVDGKPVPSEVQAWKPNDLEGELRFRLPKLALGPHTVLVRVSDWAGNRGETSFPLMAVGGDAGAIAVDFAYARGLDAGQPGTNVTVTVTGADGMGVTGLGLQVGAWPFFVLRETEGVWTGNLTLPPDAPTGSHPATLLGLDGWRNPLVKDAGVILVDGTPPQADVIGSAAGPSAARINVQADEPVTIVIRAGQSILYEATSPGASWVPTLGPLVPATTHRFLVELTDRAGNSANRTVDVTLPSDNVAPSAVTGLTAERGPAGAPRLVWLPATDDGAVARYDIVRTDGLGRAVRFANATTPFVDRDAPVGRSLSYEVTPVDLAGNLGSPATILHERVAGPGKLEASIKPDRGTVSTEFDIQVMYTHDSGEPPSTLHVKVDGKTIELASLDPEQECHLGCRYGATTKLPATQQFDRQPLVVEATWRGESFGLDVEQPPVVLDAAPSKDAPMVSPLAVLVALLALAIARRRTR